VCVGVVSLGALLLGYWGGLLPDSLFLVMLGGIGAVLCILTAL
jgi:hypothetical protein